MTDNRRNLLDRVLMSENAVLQYDKSTGGLCRWAW